MTVNLNGLIVHGGIWALAFMLGQPWLIVLSIVLIIIATAIS